MHCILNVSLSSIWNSNFFNLSLSKTGVYTPFFSLSAFLRKPALSLNWISKIVALTRKSYCSYHQWIVLDSELLGKNTCLYFRGFSGGLNYGSLVSFTWWGVHHFDFIQAKKLGLKNVINEPLVGKSDTNATFIKYIENFWLVVKTQISIEYFAY